MAGDIDREGVEKAYGRWAPVYDLVFGKVFDHGRQSTIAEADKIYLLRFVGDRSQAGFPPGTYRGTLVLTREIDGVPTELINIEKRIELR